MKRLHLTLAIVIVAALVPPGGAAIASASPSSIESESVSNLAPTNATLEAEIDTQGASAGAFYQFQLLLDPGEAPTELACPSSPPPGYSACVGPQDPSALPLGWVPGNETQTVKLDLSGAGVTLTPGRTYYFRVLVADRIFSEDTAEWETPAIFGPSEEFTTPAAPSIVSESASNIAMTGATLEAEINLHEAGAGAYFQFQLVRDPHEYASEILCPPTLLPGYSGCIGPQGAGALPIGFLAGNTLQPSATSHASLDLSSAGVTLQPATAYHYRVLVARRVRRKTRSSGKRRRSKAPIGRLRPPPNRRRRIPSRAARMGPRRRRRRSNRLHLPYCGIAPDTDTGITAGTGERGTELPIAVPRSPAGPTARPAGRAALSTPVHAVLNLGCLSSLGWRASTKLNRRPSRSFPWPGAGRGGNLPNAWPATSERGSRRRWSRRSPTTAIAGTTLRELVRIAGVSKSTFYEHFESKQECFVATLDEIVARVTEQVESRLSPEGRLPRTAARRADGVHGARRPRARGGEAGGGRVADPGRGRRGAPGARPGSVRTDDPPELLPLARGGPGLRHDRASDRRRGFAGWSTGACGTARRRSCRSWSPSWSIGRWDTSGPRERRCGGLPRRRPSRGRRPPRARAKSPIGGSRRTAPAAGPS